MSPFPAVVAGQWNQSRDGRASFFIPHLAHIWALNSNLDRWTGHLYLTWKKYIYIYLYMCLLSSQMPRHLISDAHEWMNEIPTVPTYYPAKPQPRERAWRNQRGKKTLLSLTGAVHLSKRNAGVLRRAQGGWKLPAEQKGKSSLEIDFQYEYRP
uniref:Uncharacterized protein n=1 Tax=Taeniopygia guttata TaxID=59729 RepID=A0A674HV84_TAEGU